VNCGEKEAREPRHVATGCCGYFDGSPVLALCTIDSPYESAEDKQQAYALWSEERIWNVLHIPVECTMSTTKSSLFMYRERRT
jgi:hypothetical protein